MTLYRHKIQEPEIPIGYSHIGHVLSNVLKFLDRCLSGQGTYSPLEGHATVYANMDLGSTNQNSVTVSKKSPKHLCQNSVTITCATSSLSHHSQDCFLKKNGLVWIAHRAVGRGPYQGSAAKHSWVITSARRTLAVKTSSRFTGFTCCLPGEICCIPQRSTRDRHWI